MATFTRKGWDSDGRGGAFSSDEYSRYMDDLDDAILLRHDRGSRPGKTVHVHPTFKEVIEVDEKAKIAGLEEAAKAGNINARFLLGKEYAKRGDLVRAEHWLMKVAKLGGWPEAEAELSRVRQLKGQLNLISTSSGVSRSEDVHNALSDKEKKAIPTHDEDMSGADFAENPFLRMPRIQAFRIYDIQWSEGEKKYLVLLSKEKGEGKLETMGNLLHEGGFEITTEVFNTEMDAQKYGLFVRRTWGRHITQERELRWNFSQTISEFMSALRIKKSGVLT